MKSRAPRYSATGRSEDKQWRVKWPYGQIGRHLRMAVRTNNGALEGRSRESDETPHSRITMRGYGEEGEGMIH